VAAIRTEQHRLAARETTNPRHYGVHLLRYLCRETSTVHSQLRCWRVYSSARCVSAIYGN
jgi:hypothetical protein